MDDENLYWGRPFGGGNGTGVLVVAGSSGRIDTARVDLLAAHGITALGMRWFGGPGQPAVPAEVPIEFVSQGTDALLGECDRIVHIGLSYGAEAVLLSAVTDHRPDAVVALAPTDVAWQGHIVEGEPARAKFTRAGNAIPFVPHDLTWRPTTDPPRFIEQYHHSRRAAHPEVLRRATITIEEYPGDLVLVAGGDDMVWPSREQALALAQRRMDHGRSVDLIIDGRAGHPIVLPGEAPSDQKRAYAVGGDTDAPQRLGRRAWPSIARVLALS